MLGGNSMFSHASGFTINGGTFNFNPQQPPPVILSPPCGPQNSPAWGGGPDWAGYIAHLEARLAALEAVVDLNPVDSHGSQRNQSMENIPNPYDQPECGDHGWPTKFSSRGMAAMDHRDVVDVSGDWSGHTDSDASDRFGCSGCSFDSRLPERSVFETGGAPAKRGDMRDAGATGVERLQPDPRPSLAHPKH
ncbi:hypothetical protein DFH09DRAFT_1109447 [Mycena vulgaris]|nr:hypothetical protein DFH09DRAFT_1109447 [Mycena vulgaris]